jgi:hypothetical protein
VTKQKDREAGRGPEGRGEAQSTWKMASRWESDGMMVLAMVSKG